MGTSFDENIFLELLSEKNVHREEYIVRKMQNQNLKCVAKGVLSAGRFESRQRFHHSVMAVQLRVCSSLWPCHLEATQHTTMLSGNNASGGPRDPGAQHLIYYPSGLF